MAKAQKNPVWRKVRKLFNDIHLWMGIASGIILFLVCLSGTIYTFSTEIQEMLEPGKYKVTVPANGERLSAEALIGKMKDSLGKVSVNSITIPVEKDRVYQVNVKTVEKKGGRGADGVVDSSRGRGHGADKEASSVVKDASRQRPHEIDSKITSSGKDIARERVQHADNEGAYAGKDTSRKKGGIVTAGDSHRPDNKQAAPPGRGDRGTTYLVDPYTGEIKGQPKGAGADFFMFMFRLHRWLLLDTEIGRPIVGWATIIFALLVISGLVIWFPQNLKVWKQGLKIKFTGNWKRTNHDLHNTLGFYSSILLLIMALTGLTWSFPWYRTGLNNLLGVKKVERQEPLQSAIPSDSTAKALKVADFIAIADKELAYVGEYRVSMPSKKDATVQLSKARTGFFAPAAGDRLQLDQYTGAVLEKDIFRDKPLNERIAGSFKALHIGNVYGTFSKILYFIACLFATSLPVTGTLIWINKLRKKPKKKTSTSTAMEVA